MATSTRLDAKDVRGRMSFAVERLRQAAYRMERVDAGLIELRKKLEARAQVLTESATREDAPECEGALPVQIRYAQAQAVANLSRRVALGEVLSSSGRLALIAGMAVTRWVHALRRLGEEPTQESTLRMHIEAGRLAHRMLVALLPKAELRSGCGQLASAVVVAEFVHPENALYVDDKIEEGLHRARVAHSVTSEEDAVGAAARALGASAHLLDRLAAVAEPALVELLARATHIESEVESSLLFSRSAVRPT